MAGPISEAFGARAQSASAASIAPAKPAVNGASGVLIAIVQSKNNGVHATATGGWTKLAQVNSGASFTASLWVAAEGAASPTFTWTGSVACAAHIAYYDDPSNSVNSTVSVSGTTGSGTTSPHTSTGFTSDAINVLAVYIDAAAANTALSTPVGWASNSDTGSATDAGRTSFGSKAIATSGAGSGNISVTGAAAAWVQFQIELKGPTASGAQASKIEADAWLDPPAGENASKIEAVAWLDKGQYLASKIEADAWLDPPAGLDVSKIESTLWMDATPAFVASGNYCSIIW